MKTHLEAFTVREDKGRSYWTRIGVAFPNKEQGFVVLLDAMPASIEGQYKIVVLPPSEKPQDTPEATA